MTTVEERMVTIQKALVDLKADMAEEASHEKDTEAVVECWEAIIDELADAEDYLLSALSIYQIYQRGERK